MEAGFAARGKSHRGVAVRLSLVGIRKRNAAATGEFQFKLFLLAHLAVEEAAFDGLEAEDTPAGGDHRVDQILFGWGGGLVDFHLSGLKRLEVVIVFAFEDEGVA